MKETRVPFTAESILGFEAKRKTQTRRLVRPQPTFADDGEWHWKQWRGYDEVSLANLIAQHSPYGQPGDIILGTEMWRICDIDVPDEKVLIEYRADGFVSKNWIRVSCERSWAETRFERYVRQYRENPARWRSPRYMPKEFVRYRWPLDSVRDERLQDITLADIFAEGMTNDDWYETAPVDWFSALWDRLHPECPWESNPFVYVLGLGGE